MAKHWFDTEFIDDGETLDLISIGIVSEDNRKYYAINQECDFSKSSQWVQENVISQLPKRFVNPAYASPSEIEGMKLWKPRSLIRKEVAEFMGCIEEVVSLDPTGYQALLLKVQSRLPAWAVGVMQSSVIFAYHSKTKISYRVVSEKPEIWAYYADYDWVVFCQLFGTMMDLPKGFPMYCRDIKQWCDMLGNPTLPKQDKGEHTALEDAKHNKIMYEFLEKLEKEKRVSFNN